MKELENHIVIEESVKQQKQIEHELIGEIIPHNGHSIFKINKESKKVELAKYSNTTFTFNGENKKKIIVEDGFHYVSALNKKNALKKYLKGDNGNRYERSKINLQ